MSRIISALVVAIAAMAFDLRSVQAYEAPWCAVISVGTGSAYWDCEYASLEACVPNVLAGNRGFCNLNPAYYGGERPHRKHYARRRHRIRHD